MATFRPPHLENSLGHETELQRLRGSVYVGEFRDDQRNGQATYTFADGSVYVGEFRDDQRNGQGTYTYASGRVESGIWENGELVTPD